MFFSLETFRGIFALTIVLHHLKINTFIHQSNYIQNGGLVVDFFFVLSGFIISYNYSGKINTKQEVIDFQKKRFYRLYPLHILTLFVFVLIEFLKLFALNYTNFQPTYMPFESFNNLFSLINNFFLIHGWYGWSYNLPSWSISTEFYTYLIFALILCNFVNKKILFYLLIVLSLIIFLLEHHGFELLTKFVYPARCLYSFFIGSISYYFFKSTKKNISYKLPLVFFLLSLVFISISHNFATNYSYIIAPIIFAFTIIFTAQMRHDNFYYKILSNKFFVYLGSISYGIYMIHFAVVWFFRQTSRFYFNIDEKNNILIFGKYEGILITIFILTVVIILSHISLNYFENRFRIKK